MKLNELMVGDLILIHEPDCKGHRIDYISEIDEEVGADGELYSIGYIKPIPITAEILEKNGFVKMSNSPSPYVMLYIWSTGGVAEFADVTIQVGQDHAYKWRWDYLTLKIHLFKGDITLHKIRYIHELQHALRLCNIEKEIEIMAHKKQRQ